MRRLLLAQVVPAVVSLEPERPWEASRTSDYFLWLTDPHVDQYYGSLGQQCKDLTSTKMNAFGTLGCDPPYKLIESIADAAAEVAHHLGAEFLLFTGDFTRHNQDRMPDPYAGVTNTIEQVARILRSRMPGIPASVSVALGALGNDDFPRNYELNITTMSAANPWLSNIAQALDAARAVDTTIISDYSYGGFYEATFAGLTILTINTIVYSKAHVPSSNPLPEDPFNQFRWLRERLEKAAQEKYSVWIVGHISPGIETYGYTELWHAQYVETYLSLMRDPWLGSCVAAQLFGHVHADEFRVITGAPLNAGPVLLGGAISPIYKSLPSFRVVEYDRTTLRLISYRVYYANLSSVDSELAWHFGYNAASTYEALREAAIAGGITNRAYRNLADELAYGGSAWNTYARWYKTLHTSDLERCGQNPLLRGQSLQVRQGCVGEYICALKISTRSDFENCISAVHGMPRESLDTMVVGVPSTAEELDPDAKSPGGSFYDSARAAHWMRLLAMGLQAQALDGQTLSDRQSTSSDPGGEQHGDGTNVTFEYWVLALFVGCGLLCLCINVRKRRRSIANEYSGITHGEL